MGNVIRKTLLAVLLGTSFCFSASIGINQFSGLDSQDPPNALQPNQSQDLLNVRLQPGGRSVKKRDGYGLFQTLNAISTATVHGGYHFQKATGSDVQLWGSDTGLYASVSDASFVKIATGTVGATWQCTDNLGFAYCVTSSGVDTPVKTDGTIGNTTYQPSIPTGTIVASTPLQLSVAGVTGNLSSIYISSNTSFLNFGSGPLPTDPYIEIINAPGSRITHLAYYFGNLYWWKDQSFGYIAGSASQGTVSIVIVSNQIGTLDDSSAFWNPTSYDTGNQFSSGSGPTSTGNPYFNELQQLGGIFFRGQDNHIYQYDGYNLTRLSRIITPNIVASSRKKSNSWSQSTAADFGSGSGFTTFTDTTTNLGAVQLEGLHEVWSSTNAWATVVSSFTLLSGYIESSPVGVSAIQSVQTLNIPNQFIAISSVSFAYHGSEIPPCRSIQSVCMGAVSATGGYGACISAQGDGTANVQITKGSSIDNTVSSGSNFSCDFSTHTLALNRNASGFMQAYLDGSLQTTATDTSSNSFSNSYIFCNGNNDYCHIFSYDLSATTGTYYSAVENAPNLSLWESFISNNSLPGNSSINYFTRSSTNSFTTLSSTPAWVSQSNNSNVATSTGTFFQERSDFSITAATQIPALNDFTFNWFEGAASDKAYIQYFQDAILFSVSSGSSTATNNTTFYLDLLNNTWLKDNIPSNGFIVENNYLYIGDPLSSNIYKFGGVQADNGVPIQSYWKSMDFTGQDPTVQNDYDQADFAFGESSNTVSFTYQVDQNPSLTIVKSIPLYSVNNSILKRGFALDKKAIGTYFNFSVGDNSSLSPWTLMGERTTYNPLSWRPQESN